MGSRLQISSWLSKTLLPKLEEASEGVSAFTLSWAALGELLSSGANWPPTSGGQRCQDGACWWAHSAASGSVQARHTYGQNSQELDVKVHGSKPQLPGPPPHLLVSLEPLILSCSVCSCVHSSLSELCDFSSLPVPQRSQCFRL